MTEASPPLCAEVSRTIGETLIGTASKDGLRFVLVETDDVWGRDAFESSTLPEPAKAHLWAAVSAYPRTRLVFVRPPGRRVAVPRVYVTGGASRGERVLVIDLESFEAIASAPIQAMLGGEVPPGARVLDEPVVLVCAHGKRDRCCAKFGVALAEALTAEPGMRVLQCSHLGGHRFAAAVVTLPDGLTYGHLGVNDAPLLASAVREGHLFDPARYRGRSGLDEPQQVAEARLRIDRQLPTAAVVEIVSVEKSEAGALVRMKLGDEPHEYTVRRRILEVVRPASCFEPPSPSYTFDSTP
jgi:hypothetical protein